MYKVQEHAYSMRQVARGNSRPSLSMVADVTTFVIAAGASFIAKVGGDLPLSQIVVVVLLPILLITRANRLRRVRLGTLFILLGLWSAGQVVTDVYRGAATIDWMRSHARMSLLGIDVLALATPVGGSTRRHLIFYAGLMTGNILQVKLQPNEFTDFWKFGYAAGATLFVVLTCCYFYRRRQHLIVLLLLMGISCVHVAFNFRSPILQLFVTAVVTLPVIPERVGKMRLLPRSLYGRVLIKICMALIAAWAASTVLLFLSAQGYLGEAARAKNEAQAESKGGLLLGGRPEIIISSRAVIDSPLIGHGSGAKDYRYVEMFSDLQEKYGPSSATEGREADTGGAIPSHSHVMAAWVDAGVFGGVFWIYVFVLTLRAIAQASVKSPALAPVYCYSLVGLLWSILFSPGGSVTILPDSFLIIVACDILRMRELRR